jgi:sugar/nucleoside kinase (ribokinase family)
MGTALLNAKAFHMLATPEEIEVKIPELHRLRQECGIEAPPFIVWEPFPAACTKHNKNAFLQACRLVDVFSPNHREITAMFEDGPSGGFDPTQLEDHAQHFCKAVGPSAKGIVILRAGEHGSLTSRCHDVVENVWLPPFYQLGTTKVVDPTGAGNAFLGGFMQGWIASQDMREASIYGIVAASFAIEQIGMPRCEVVGQDEFWNGVNVQHRLEEYKARLQNSNTH